MRMRLKLPELLTEHKPRLTAYAVAKASNGRISLSTIYRLDRSRGRVANFDGELLEALCDVFGLSPGALLGDGKAAGRKRQAELSHSKLRRSNFCTMTHGKRRPTWRMRPGLVRGRSSHW